MESQKIHRGIRSDTRGLVEAVGDATGEVTISWEEFNAVCNIRAICENCFERSTMGPRAGVVGAVGAVIAVIAVIAEGVGAIGMADSLMARSLSYMASFCIVNASVERNSLMAL